MPKISWYSLSSATWIAFSYVATSASELLVDAVDRQRRDQVGGELLEPVQAPGGQRGDADQHAHGAGDDHAGRGDAVLGRRDHPQHGGRQRRDDQAEAEPGEGQVDVQARQREPERGRAGRRARSDGQPEMSQYATAAISEAAPAVTQRSPSRGASTPPSIAPTGRAMRNRVRISAPPVASRAEQGLGDQLDVDQRHHQRGAGDQAAPRAWRRTAPWARRSGRSAWSGRTVSQSRKSRNTPPPAAAMAGPQGGSTDSSGSGL